MSSPLSGIEAAKRRQFAATLGLFATLFIAVGAVAATGATTAVVKAFVAVSLLVALVLGLMAWGVVRSVRLDAAEQRLDAAIDAVVRSNGRQMCDCDVEHDPTEMHIVGDDHALEACEHDGSGADCAHSCENCVLSAMRPSPNRTRAQRLHGTAT
ncbi:MAG TPA: hypothetical protein VKB75_01825 [Jatrophihabitans sp.]|nr:hypothetical protein [Jatrophihabitans sp.]